jgi:hypothetical protein
MDNRESSGGAASTQPESPAASSGPTAFLRYQEETERIKKRLLTGSSHSNTNHSNNPPPADRAPAVSPTSLEPPSIELIEKTPYLIETAPSTSNYFADPVPARQMSSHLKSEHEAFKARYANATLTLRYLLCYLSA